MKHRSFRYEVQRAAVVLAWLTAASLAHAQQNAPRSEARLRLTTPGSCITEAGIAAGVHQRSDSIAFVARDDVPVLEVAVAERGREMQAELSVRWPDGRVAQRRLAAQSCQQLTAAVALLISMTLEPAGEDGSKRDGTPASSKDRREGAMRDKASGAPPSRNQPSDRRGGSPRARGETDDARDRDENSARRRENSGTRDDTSDERRENGVARGDASDARRGAAGARGESSDARGSSFPARDAAGSSDAAAGQLSDSRSAGAAPAADGGGAAATASRPPTSANTEPPAADGGGAFLHLDQWSLGAQGVLQFGAAPRPLPGLGAYLWLAWHGAPPWSPALRLDFGRAWLDDYAAIGGKASFALTTASLELCPLALRAGPFAGHVCAAAQLGALAAHGSDTYRPQAHTQPWSAFGAALLASARVTSWAEVQLGAVLRAPAQRDRFAFAPDVFHRVGWITGELRASLGVRFP